MVKTKAFTKLISPHGTNSGENNAVNQSSPAWVLTFVRWNVRDTLRAPYNTANTDLLSVRAPLVVENDCIDLVLNVSKSNLTHSMQATLVETDVNYETSIAPGDFVFVNILNWESDARRIVNIARSKQTGQINHINDGFKGFFKIQRVSKNLSVDQNGAKRVVIKISGFAFTEFNNCIYFNPYLRRDNQGTDKDDLLFVTNLGTDYSQLITASNNPSCQDMIKSLINSFIGKGVTDQGQQSAGDSVIIPNVHFYIPKQVGVFLGNPSATAAKDVYDYLFGIQQYSGSATQNIASGLNPSNLNAPVGRFRYTSQNCEGNTLLKAEYWNQQVAWGILNQYTNSPLNELFTCFRTSPEGNVMPTVVFRQIPFTTEGFGKAPFDTDVPVTKFLSLPRWKIDSALIFSTDLGRDEAARINFVQYYAQPPAELQKVDGYMSAQTASKNYVYDVNDVQRSGLRPYVVTTSFEDLTISKDKYIGRKCALIIGDALIGEHLRMNGTIECVGIVDPIAVGDNLEYDGVVYHIEEVNHICTIDRSIGIKSFRTILRVSHGVSIIDSREQTAYAEMIHTNAYNDRKANYDSGTQSLPGISESQDVSYRPVSPDPTQKNVNRPDAPFAQPGQYVKPAFPTGDDNE